MSTLHVKYTYSDRVISDTRGCQGDWSGYCETKLTYKILGVTVSKPDSSYYDAYEIEGAGKGSIVYVVVVRYSTSDTFSSSSGHGCIEGLYLDETLAEQTAESIKNGTYKPEQKYHPWTGYFERLEDVSVELYKVKE